MSIITKTKTSWELFKISLQIIAKHKKLLVFSVIVTALSFVIALCFLVPVVFWNTGYPYTSLIHWKTMAEIFFDLKGLDDNSETWKPFVGLIFFGTIYLTSMFVTIFFSVAFSHEILAALNGDQVSIRRGFSFAISRLKAIFIWSMMAGLVGVFIKILEDHFGLLGRWIFKFIGIAWSVASVFAIPVLIREENIVNPVEVLRKSALTLKQSWGESLISYIGLQLGSLFIILGSVIYFVLMIGIAVYLKSFIFGLVTFLTWIFAMLLLSFVSNVAGQIYKCALFIYASEGVLPENYTAEMMNSAWKVKK